MLARSSMSLVVGLTSVLVVAAAGCEALVTEGIPAGGTGGSAAGPGIPVATGTGGGASETGGANGAPNPGTVGTGGSGTSSSSGGATSQPGSGGAGPAAGSGGSGTGGSEPPSSGTGGNVAPGTGGRFGTGGANGSGSGGSRAPSGTGGMTSGSGGTSSPGTGGAGTTGGSGGAGGAAAPTTDCGPYPTGPALVDTRFQVGTVVPNLTFTKEDGSQVSFGTIRCNKKAKLLYWATGGDNCGPCVSNATRVEIPAWKELGEQGLTVLESFNGQKFLVSGAPFTNWRRKTMWPADSESIILANEPATKPFYAMGRVASAIPWMVTIDLETMKVVSLGGSPTLARVRTMLAAATPRQ